MHKLYHNARTSAIFLPKKDVLAEFSASVSNANPKLLAIARHSAYSNEEHIMRYVVDKIL